MEKFVYGFNPSSYDRFVRILASAFINVFRLNSNSKIATEICQLLSPQVSVLFNGRCIQFKTGHGRLLWRAKTLQTEEPLMTEWIQSFTSNDVFLDIGANVGTYTIPAAMQAKLVIAVELDFSNVYCLHTNVSLNRLHDKVVIVPLVASYRSELVDVYYRDLSLGDALQSVGAPQKLPTKMNAPFKTKQLAMSIDEAIKAFSLPTPTKIKIDVDGNEEIVLAGCWNTIQLAHEIYYEDNDIDRDTSLVDKIVSLGFSVIASCPARSDSVKSTIGTNILFRKVQCN